MFGTVFALLYVAHLVADYPLQTDHQAAHKAQPSRLGLSAGATHATVHGVVACVALAVAAIAFDAEISPWSLTIAVWFIAVTHFLIDRRTGVEWWMRRFGQSEFAKHGGAAHVDQTAHVVCLAIAAAIVSV